MDFDLLKQKAQQALSNVGSAISTGVHDVGNAITGGHISAPSPGNITIAKPAQAIQPAQPVPLKIAQPAQPTNLSVQQPNQSTYRAPFTANVAGAGPTSSSTLTLKPYNAPPLAASQPVNAKPIAPPVAGKAPPTPPTLAQKAAHFVGNTVSGFTKPIEQIPADVTLTAANLVNKAIGRQPITAQQIAQNPHSELYTGVKYAGASGKNVQTAADIGQAGLNFAFPGLENVIGKGINIVAPEAARAVVPATSRVAAGAVLGGPYNVANLATSNVPINRQSLANAYAQGTGYGALFGAGGEVLNAGIGGLVNLGGKLVSQFGEPALQEAERASGLNRSNIINDNEAAALHDLANNGNVHPHTQTALDTAGIDTSGTPQNVVDRINNYLDQRSAFIRTHNQVAQGGYIAGPQAAGFNEADLNGKTFQGAEGIPRFEADDSQATVNTPTTQTSKLGNVLNHPSLFRDYPQLQDVNVSVITPKNDQLYGGYSKRTNTIYVNQRIIDNPDLLKNTLFHETQHAIQNIEGFTQGTTSKASGSAGYRQNLGEQEAAQVGKRVNLTPEQRGNQPLQFGNEQQIRIAKADNEAAKELERRRNIQVNKSANVNQPNEQTLFGTNELLKEGAQADLFSAYEGEQGKDRYGNTFTQDQVPVNKLIRNAEFQPRVTASGKGTEEDVYKNGYRENPAQPMIVNKVGDKYIVLGGHSRTLGLERRAAEGLPNPETVRARVYDNITPAQAREISRGANQGVQYESTLDMAKSISDSKAEGQTPAVQKQNLIKGFTHDDYASLWDTVKDRPALKEKIIQGALPSDEVLAAIRQGRIEKLNPDTVAAVLSGLDKNGNFSRQNAINVIKLLSGKIKAGAARDAQTGLFGNVEQAVNTTDLLKEYQKTSADLIRKRNALAVASKELEGTEAQKLLDNLVTEYNNRLQSIGDEIMNRYRQSQPLSQNHEDYFNTEKTQATVPIDKLVSSKSEAENAQSSINAEKIMSQAGRGEVPKRDPIKVTPMADGTYKVVDGNATFTAAQRMGWKDLPVQIVHKDEPDSLLAAAKDFVGDSAKYDKNFQETLAEIAKDTGNRHLPGPVKSAERVAEKATNDYAGDLDKVKDSVRATIEVSNPRNLQGVINKIANRFKITNIKDGYTQNMPGYKDVKVNVKLPNGKQAEILMATPEMLKAKNELGGHELYEQARTTVDAKKLADLETQMRTLYDQADAVAERRLASSGETSVPSTKALAGEKGAPVSTTEPETVPPSETSLTSTSSTSKNRTPGEVNVAIRQTPSTSIIPQKEGSINISDQTNSGKDLADFLIKQDNNLEGQQVELRYQPSGTQTVITVKGKVKSTYGGALNNYQYSVNGGPLLDNYKASGKTFITDDKGNIHQINNADIRSIKTSPPQAKTSGYIRVVNKDGTTDYVPTSKAEPINLQGRGSPHQPQLPIRLQRPEFPELPGPKERDIKIGPQQELVREPYKGNVEEVLGRKIDTSTYTGPNLNKDAFGEADQAYLSKQLEDESSTYDAKVKAFGAKINVLQAIEDGKNRDEIVAQYQKDMGVSSKVARIRTMQIAKEAKTHMLVGTRGENPITETFPGVKSGDHEQGRINVQVAEQKVGQPAIEAIYKTAKLSEPDRMNFFDYVEGTKPVKDAQYPEQVQTAIDAFRRADDTLHATVKALGGKTPYVLNHAVHDWDLSDAKEAQRFNKIASLLNRNYKYDDYAGFHNQPRVFATLEEGRTAGFHEANPDHPEEVMAQYFESGLRNVRQQSIAKFATEADFKPPELAAEERTRSLELPYSNGKSISLSEDAYKQWRNFQQRDEPALLHQWYRKASGDVKATLLSISLFHPININMLQAVPTLIGRGHLVYGIQAAYRGWGALLSNDYAHRLMQANIDDGTNEAAARMGTPVRYSSDLGGQSNPLKFTGPHNVGEKRIFENSVPVVHSIMVKAAVKDLDRRNLSIDSPEAHRLGKEINGIMGFVNDEVLNKNPHINGVARDVLLANQFTRAKWGVLKDAITQWGQDGSGLAGSYARRAVVGKYATEFIIALAVSAMLKQGYDSVKDLLIQTAVQPSIPTPFKNQKGENIRIGLPANYISEAAGLGATLRRNQQGRLGVKVGSPTDILNNLGNYGRARLSPVPSTALKIATNTTFLNNPLYDRRAPAGTKAIQIATNTIGSNLPIPLQGIGATSIGQRAISKISPTAAQAIKMANPQGFAASLGSSFGFSPRADTTTGVGQSNAQYWDLRNNLTNALDKGNWNDIDPSGKLSKSMQNAGFTPAMVQALVNEYNNAHPNNMTDFNGNKYPTPWNAYTSQDKLQQYTLNNQKTGDLMLGPSFYIDKQLSQSTPGFPSNPLFKLNSDNGAVLLGENGQSREAPQALVALIYNAYKDVNPGLAQAIKSANGGNNGWLAQYENSKFSYDNNYVQNMTNYLKSQGASAQYIQQYWQQHPNTPEPFQYPTFSPQEQGVANTYFNLLQTQTPGSGQASQYFTQNQSTLQDYLDRVAQYTKNVMIATAGMGTQGFPAESQHVQDILNAMPNGTDSASKKARAQLISSNPDVNQYLADVALYEVLSKGGQFAYINPNNPAATEGQNINAAGLTGQSLLKSLASLGQYDIGKNATTGEYSFMQQGAFPAGTTAGGTGGTSTKKPLVPLPPKRRAPHKQSFRRPKLKKERAKTLRIHKTTYAPIRIKHAGPLQPVKIGR